jgi:hypothetical protein
MLFAEFLFVLCRKETIMRYLRILNLIVLFLISATACYAAPFSQTYENDYQTDQVFLFITEGNVEFSDWKKLSNGWEVGTQEPDLLSASGPEINPGQRFKYIATDNVSYTLQWAELLNGVVQGSGSLFAENGRFVGSSDEFTATLHTPIANSIWLLGSGLIGLVCLGRRVMRSNC